MVLPSPVTAMAALSGPSGEGSLVLAVTRNLSWALLDPSKVQDVICQSGTLPLPKVYPQSIHHVPSPFITSTQPNSGKKQVFIIAVLPYVHQICIDGTVAGPATFHRLPKPAAGYLSEVWSAAVMKGGDFLGQPILCAVASTQIAHHTAALRDLCLFCVPESGDALQGPWCVCAVHPSASNMVVLPLPDICRQTHLAGAVDLVLILEDTAVKGYTAQGLAAECPIDPFVGPCCASTSVQSLHGEPALLGCSVRCKLFTVTACLTNHRTLKFELRVLCDLSASIPTYPFRLSYLDTGTRALCAVSSMGVPVVCVDLTSSDGTASVALPSRRPGDLLGRVSHGCPWVVPSSSSVHPVCATAIACLHPDTHRLSLLRASLKTVAVLDKIFSKLDDAPERLHCLALPLKQSSAHTDNSLCVIANLSLGSSQALFSGPVPSWAQEIVTDTITLSAAFVRSQSGGQALVQISSMQVKVTNLFATPSSQCSTCHWTPPSGVDIKMASILPDEGLLVMCLESVELNGSAVSPAYLTVLRVSCGLIEPVCQRIDLGDYSRPTSLDTGTGPSGSSFAIVGVFVAADVESSHVICPAAAGTMTGRAQYYCICYHLPELLNMSCTSLLPSACVSAAVNLHTYLSLQDGSILVFENVPTATGAEPKWTIPAPAHTVPSPFALHTHPGSPQILAINPARVMCVSQLGREASPSACDIEMSKPYLAVAPVFASNGQLQLAAAQSDLSLTLVDIDPSQDVDFTDISLAFSHGHPVRIHSFCLGNKNWLVIFCEPPPADPICSACLDCKFYEDCNNGSSFSVHAFSFPQLQELSAMRLLHTLGTGAVPTCMESHTAPWLPSGLPGQVLCVGHHQKGRYNPASGLLIPYLTVFHASQHYMQA